MKQTKTYTIAREHPLECPTRRILCALVCAGVLLYMLFVSLSVVHVVARKEAHVQAVATASQIAALEGELFALNDRIVANEAAERGLSVLSDKHFVKRTSTLGRADVY